jgi:hypothetical protein
MQGRKITAKEFHHKKPATKKTATVKVLSGKTIIDDPFLKIPANTYRWFVLVPAELLQELNWNQVFRVAYKNRMIKTGAVQEKLEYDNFDLQSGAVLFAFK